MQGIKEKTMSFWQILGRLAISNEGETIQRVSDETYVSTTGVTYTQIGATTVGADGSVFLHRWAATIHNSFTPQTDACTHE